MVSTRVCGTPQPFLFTYHEKFAIICKYFYEKGKL